MAEKCQRSYINAFAFSSKRANYSCFTVHFKHCLEPQIAHIEKFSGALNISFYRYTVSLFINYYLPRILQYLGTVITEGPAKEFLLYLKLLFELRKLCQHSHRLTRQPPETSILLSCWVSSRENRFTLL